MAQRVGTPQGTKRRYPDMSSPPGLHAGESESRRPPYPPPSAMGGLQAPQVGVAVVTIDMFRDYQRQVAATFERQGAQIALLQERVQAVEGRVQSLEDAEDMAIDAVREIRDNVIPRVERHHADLGALAAAVAGQSTALEALSSPGQEYRSNQGRDAARPSQPAWRPGPLGGATDQAKSAMEDMKTQLTRSFASLAEHDRRLGESDARLVAYDAHLTDCGRRVVGHDTRLVGHERQLGDHNTRLAAHDRHFGEHDVRLRNNENHLRDHDLCVAKHTERLGVLEKANEQLLGRVTVLERGIEHKLSPTQITAIMQNHQQRLESLEQNWQQRMKASQEAQVARPHSPYDRSHSASGEARTLVRRVGLESRVQAEELGKAPEKAQGSEAQSQRPDARREGTLHAPDLRRLGEQLAAIDKRIVPLEQRMGSIETGFEKLSQKIS
ncbi:putative chromosome segregation ATPase-like protein [Rosellinia necatrix]|uniref:Putative chromosome segregation ATPase-like protein n=1 Tax=Rosellinia necatrix TaxID=77044 RepID=A0A1W2TNV5_ROSNE|nr:putative chromosome segregation ATPase-like protein [Rosellinia necatrix]